MGRETEEATQTVGQFIRLVAAKDWDAVRQMLAEDFEAYWPLSNEQIDNIDNFIESLRRYPFTDTIQILDLLCEYDQWDKDFTVSAQVSIESKAQDGSVSKAHSVSFLALDWESRITSMTEYRAVIQDPAEWRKGLLS